jgi:hypothetical protein
VTCEEAVRLIEAARGPADLFGADAAGDYRRLARLTHPDTSPDRARTRAAFGKLAALWQQHRGGTGGLVAQGDLANLYQVREGLSAGPVVSKALATIGAGRGALTVAAPPADLGGPSGNTRL